LESFTNVLQQRLKPFELESQNHIENNTFQQPENFKSDLKELEKEHAIVLQQKENLEKYNLNLQEQISRYGILLTEQKAETREALVKYDTLQKEFHEKVESLFREKSLFEKRYFLVLGFLINGS